MGVCPVLYIEKEDEISAALYNPIRFYIKFFYFILFYIYLIFG